METMLHEADIFVTIDADLQDDIAAIPKMVAKYKEGYEIVYGVRSKRDTDSWFKRTTALGFYRLMQHLGTKSVFNHADFRLIGPPHRGRTAPLPRAQPVYARHRAPAGLQERHSGV